MRTTRKELESLVTLVAKTIGRPKGMEPGKWKLDYSQYGGYKLCWKEDRTGGEWDLFGELRVSAGEMAHTLRAIVRAIELKGNP